MPDWVIANRDRINAGDPKAFWSTHHGWIEFGLCTKFTDVDRALFNCDLPWIWLEADAAKEIICARCKRNP